MSETAQQQIDRLAQFIMDEVPGEPSASEGAVDYAIRLLREAADALDAPLVLTAEERQELGEIVEWTPWKPEYGERGNEIATAIREGRGIR